MARILVVEDDRNANRLLCAVLRKDGHEALSAADGRMRSASSTGSTSTS